MQDVHWFTGLIGYFPTYTMGALTAAQLFAAARAAGVADTVRQGGFAPLVGWLRDNVHARASARSTMQIVRDATGAPLGTDAFLAHVARRYGAGSLSMS